MDTNINQYLAKNYNKELVVVNIERGVLHIVPKNPTAEEYGYTEQHLKEEGFEFRFNAEHFLMDNEFECSGWEYDWNEDFDKEEVFSWAIMNQGELERDVVWKLRARYDGLIDTAFILEETSHVEEMVQEANDYGVPVELEDVHIKTLRSQQ